ncbi:MAG: hypothetical protein ABI599_05675 [Flavobacteriales bacterium]
MAKRRSKVAASVKTVARVARPARAVRPARPAVKRSKPKRKILLDRSLFGALPGMGDWALPLLKQLRNE